MAVAGLHNVSAFGPWWDNERNRPTTRASSVLRMWRELEGDHVVSPSHMSRQHRIASNPECASTGQDSSSTCNISEDANDAENRVLSSSEMEHEDNNSVTSEQSSDLGESERERVRQIFREWKKSGASNCSGPQWLGECERVILRSGSEVATEAADSQVRDGLMNHHQENRVRRPIRKLCGRQTLVDLLLRAQCERKGELHHLSEQKPVSEFAHRNRIQALLRGRFLRNERSVTDKRPSSVAATELDFLRQRQTVSDRREEFLSKLDHSASTSSNSAESDSSSCHENNKSESIWMERVVDSEIHTMSDSAPVEGNSRTHHNPWLGVTQSVDNVQEGPLPQSRDRQLTESQSNQNEEIELQASLPNELVDQEVSVEIESVPGGEEQILETLMSEQEASVDIEHADIINSEHMDTITISNDSTFETDHISEAHVNRANFDEITDREIELRDVSSHLDVLQDSDFEIQESSLQQPNSIPLTEWTAHNREEEDDLPRNWHGTFSNQWFQETPETTSAALDHDDDRIQEPHEDWQSHDLQEAIDSWLFLPSTLDVGVSLGRFHYNHFPDDETTQSMEIRELSSRRQVTSLLRSSFRESLDQVLQSHMERQVHFSSGDLEEEPSSPVLIEQADEELLNVERSLNISDAIEANQFDPSSTFITESNRLWDDELNSESFLHANSQSNQILGTEWEIINELRIDMARLHQRMNNMQSMLEACIDMQIELQRCMRQEVSAALNRTILTRDEKAAKDKTIDNKSQLEHVRKGICCLCAESKIDSLLYRCGHMCTCSECAVKLVRDNGKCPMCQAPIVEAVRAYFIQ